MDQQATALDAGNDDDLDDEHGSATLVSADEQAQFEQVARNIGALSFFIESLQGNPDGAASRFSFDAASGIFHADLLGPAKAPEHKLAHSDAASVPVPAPSAVDHADTLPPPGAPETALTSMAPPETSAAPAGASTAVAGQGSGIDVQHESTRHAGADQPETAPPTSADAAEQATHAPHRSEEADVATAANTPDVVAGSPHSGEEAVASDASEVPAPIDESALDTMRVPQRPGPPVAPLPVSVVPQSDAAVDAELLDIFLGEAAEVLDFVRQTVPRLEQQPASHEHLTALRRSFHTLKGSGRMVGLMAFGEAAWSMEQVFNLYLSEHRGAGEHLLALLAMADGELGAWIAELRDAGVSQRDGAALKQAARLLLDADTQAHPNAGTCGSTADTAAAAPPASSDSAAQTEQEIRAAPAAELAPVEASEAAESIEETKVVDQAQAVDVVDTAVAAASLEEIQAVEEVQAVDAMEAAHAAESVAEIQGVQEGQFVDVEGRSVDVDEAAKAAKSFEEIKKVDEVEAADTVEAVEAAKAVEETKPVEEIIAVDVVEAIEVPEAIEGPEAIEADEAMQAASVAEVQEAPLATVIGFPGRHTAEVPRDDTIKRIGTLEISVPLHNIYLAETDELVRLLANDLAEWRHEPERRVNTLAVNAAHSLAGSSATVGFTSLQDLAHALELVLHTLVRLPDPLRGFEFDALAAAIECMRRMLTQFALGELAGPELRHVQALQELKARILARAVPLPVEEQEEDEVATAASSLVEDQAANDPELDAEIDLDIDFDLGPTFVIEPVAPVVTVVQEAEPVPDIPEISEASLKALADDLEHGETLVSSASALSGADQEQDSAELTDFDLDLDAEIDLQEASAAAFADTDADADKAGMQPGQQQASGAQDIDDAQPGSGADSSDDSAANRSGNHAAFDAAGNEDGGQAAAAEAEARFEREEFSAAQLGAAAKLIAAATILPVMLAEDLVPPTEVLYEHEHSGAAATSRIPKDELDADLLPVFIEEASDILPEMGRNLRQLMETPGERSSVQSLLRLLHTIKGSSRMAGAMVLGQHLHEMESRIEQVTLQGAPSQAAVEELLARFDVALSLFDRLQNPLAADAMPAAPGQNPASAAPAPASDPAPAVPASDPAPTVPASVPAPAVPEPAATGKRAKAAQARKAAKGAAKAADAAADVVPVAAGAAPLPSQAIVPAVVTAPAPALPVSLVRVRADILDRLVNQAGEVSISRSRVETDVALLKSSLSELSDNVARLQGQLREIEIQAESQMASQMQQANDREFDPLEFDRFTRLQELTRIMAESVNDVASVQQNLSRTVDDASNNLGQQARITRDLQQDLMRVRMVQFGSISERLYRITRQASKELDKRVNLDIRGGAVEIDRSVLEKMTGPFEHLLRNSIVHGIESRAERTAAGKNETGELLVEVRQAGNEVVIHVSDDGRGLDLDRIAEKARATGLLSADSEPSEAEVRDMIFHPGFSTAREITELAGRGIGMDVVRAEAVSLGGRISIESSAGKGAQFTIHLPLTLAVTQVVVLATGGKTYAVPSVLVEQVQQLKSTALVAAYNEGAVLWMGQRVPMFYLSALLGDHVTAPLTQQYTPVLILKSGTQRVAVHVDAVLGNREVVIKNIGPQLSRMIGVAGATVLGAGDIVLILDPVPLAQRHASDPSRGMRPQTSEHSQVQLANAVDIADAAYPHLEQAGSLELGAVAELNEILLPAPQTARAPLQTVDTAPAAARPALPPSVSAPAGVSTPVQGLRTQRTVMVVDDSLTVRRVTQRMLAREGYQVVLAKDGVDALEQLQAIRPDVMLVDIEMPRMDGFDLTRNVRSDERTRAIPIIMITSRTAVKHRTYAMELGVNEYLGKPYQEEQLLKLVAGFVRSEVPAA
ncbi:MAG: Hpt domain-containing protein [Janthinobacterium lividum]